MKKKVRVGIIFGGKSAEHEVSLQSAKNIIDAIDKDKYEIVPIGIDKTGKWQLNTASQYLLNDNNPKLIKLNKENSKEVALVPGQSSQQLVTLSNDVPEKPIDVAFPVLHGPFGEDGTVQGLLKLLDVPFVGAGVLGSAVGMDKDVMKRLLKGAGVPIADFICLDTSSDIDLDKIIEQLGLPIFTKPANLGSSVGVSKANTKEELETAIKIAFEYDNKILVEEAIVGDEVECSILGNENPIASVAGRIIPNHEFYSYQAKYIDENGALLEIPAKLPAELMEEVQQVAIKAFKALCLEGMARVDMFLRDGKEVIINEVNTIPGFTKISMYPKLWEASGISYTELIDKLIQLAIERHNKEKRLKTSYDL